MEADDDEADSENDLGDSDDEDVVDVRPYIVLCHMYLILSAFQGDLREGGDRDDDIDLDDDEDL